MEATAIQGLYSGYTRGILFGDNGKANGSYYIIIGYNLGVIEVASLNRGIPM